MSWILRLLNLLPHDTIMVGGKPYLTRYFLTGTPERALGEGRTIRIHHFHQSDQGRDLHSHPWTGWSLILKGGYIEERMGEPVKIKIPVGTRYETATFPTTFCRYVLPGNINRIGLDDFHRAELIDPVKGCWTLFFTGRRVQDWGFADKKTGIYQSHKDYPRTRKV